MPGAEAGGRSVSVMRPSWHAGHRRETGRGSLHLAPRPPVAADEHHAAADLQPVALQFQPGLVGLVAVGAVDLALVLATAHRDRLRDDVAPEIVALHLFAVLVVGLDQ